MIIDIKCPDCKKQTTCKWYDVLAKFDPDKKTPISVDMQFICCQEYEEVE